MNTNIELPEIELQSGDIIEGSKHTRKVILHSDNPNYDGKTVVVRNLKSKEFNKITENMPIEMGLSEVLQMSLEACRIGIVNKDVAKMVDDFPPDIIDQIGGAILGSTKPKEQAVKDFSNPAKDK